MNNKGLLGIIIAVILFLLIVLIGETTLSVWRVIVGFLLFCMLTLFFVNSRNAFSLLIMTLVLLVTVYLAVKDSLWGIIPGGVAGIAVGLLMHFGWIAPHRPFSRSEYIRAQKRIAIDSKETK